MIDETLCSGTSILLALSLSPESIKQIQPLSKRPYYRAAVNWLTKYQPPHNSSNIDRLKGHLESFYHFKEVEDWQSVSILFMQPLRASSKSELYWLLFGWGYYQEQLNICQQMFEQGSPEIKTICQNGIGIAFSCLGQYSQSVEAYQKSLIAAKEINNRRGEANALGNLGVAYRRLGEYSSGIKFRDSIS
jgi:tetratricopeptide (TPR) repeat protein